MESLSDLIKPKVPLDNQSKQIVKDEWYMSKEKLDAIPNDFIAVFKKVNSTRPYDTRKRKIRAGYEINVDLLPINGHEAVLTFIERNDKSIAKAWYIMFDNKNNRSYVRDVLNNPTL